jgi:hypothetical protein
VLNNAKALASQGFQGYYALFKCKDFGGFTAKTLHLSLVHCDAPTKIHIVYMSELHKNG